MLTRLHISSFIGLTIAVWLFVLWMQGMPVLKLEFIRPFSTVVGCIAFVVLVFNKWAWAWAVFRGWYVNRPDLRGTWEVELKSDWVDPKTQQQIPPIIAYAVFRQSLTSLSMRLMTKESKSKLIAYSIEEDEDGSYKLSGIYRNEPKIELQGVKSEIHHGSLFMEVYGVPPESMEGHYWTDRGTRGSLRLTKRRAEFFDTYEQAENVCKTN